MNDWDASFKELDFRPAQVAEMTGTSTELLRLWAHRYLDFRTFSVAGGTVDGHRWYSWVGVQMVQVFSEVLSDLRDANEARKALMIDPIEGFHRSPGEWFQYDYRSDADDRLLVRNLADPAGIFARASASDVRLPIRGYVYNFSDMQRRLAAAVARTVAGFDQQDP